MRNRKKENNMLGKSYRQTRDIYPQNLPLLFNLEMNQSFSVMFQL